MTVAAFVRQLQAEEVYAFSLEEVAANVSKSTIAIKREISRLVGKGEVVNLRKGFYLIIPPRYAAFRKLPIWLYSEKLFTYLERRYYLGLYTAAQLHGASHQQAQRDYLITEQPKQGDIKRNTFDIRFLTTVHWPEDNIMTRQSDAGIYQLSTPVLTFADLVHYHTKIGGLNRALSVLEELVDEIREEDAVAFIAWYDHRSTLQRAGFLLEEIVGNGWLTEIFFEAVQKGNYYPTLLSPAKNEKAGKAANRWKIHLNVKLDSDL